MVEGLGAFLGGGKQVFVGLAGSGGERGQAVLGVAEGFLSGFVGGLGVRSSLRVGAGIGSLQVGGGAIRATSSARKVGFGILALAQGGVGLGLGSLEFGPVG